MKLIGVNGYAQTGKDSVAAFLAQHGYERRAFADPIRDALYRVNPWLTAQTETCTTRIRYAELIDRLGYEGARRTPYCVEIRLLLQRLGMTVRDIIGPDVWIETAMRGVGVDTVHYDIVGDNGLVRKIYRRLYSAVEGDASYVFTDCRFPNEAQAITDAGGEVWRVERPGFGPINDHPSETALDGWDFDVRICNDGSLDRLDRAVSVAVRA